MDTDPELRRRADEVLKATKEAYGFIPVVNQVLSERSTRTRSWRGTAPWNRSRDTSAR